MSRYRSAFAALVCAGALSCTAVTAQDISRLDVLALVNREAHKWMLDADNVRLDIDFLRIPRGDGELGKVCGRIASLGRRADPRAFQSYSATLWIEGGRLSVAGMSSFFMSIDELLAGDFCR